MVLKEESKFWKDLSIFYMTEESDCDSDLDVVIEHKIPWRSKGYQLQLCQYICIQLM